MLFLNRLGADHCPQCDRQTDGQTDRTAFSNRVIIVLLLPLLKEMIGLQHHDNRIIANSPSYSLRAITHTHTHTSALTAGRRPTPGSSALRMLLAFTSASDSTERGHYSFSACTHNNL